MSGDNRWGINYPSSIKYRKTWWGGEHVLVINIIIKWVSPSMDYATNYRVRFFTNKQLLFYFTTLTTVIHVQYNNKIGSHNKTGSAKLKWTELLSKGMKNKIFPILCIKLTYKVIDISPHSGIWQIYTYATWFTNI